MKKAIILGMSVLALSVSFSSCKKTSKRKVSKDWKVSKYENTTSTVSENIDGESGTRTENGGNTSVSKTVKVNEWTWTIDKKGTWSENKNVTYSYTSSGIQVVEEKTSKVSGTWAFLSKNKSGEFKKNERIAFTILKEEDHTKKTSTLNGNSTVEESSYTGNDTGYDVDVVYTVKESKGKSLVLVNEYKESWVDSGDSGSMNGSWDYKEVITFEKKK